MQVTTVGGMQIEINQNHIVYVGADGEVICNRQHYMLDEASAAKCRSFIRRVNIVAEAEAKKQAVAALASEGRKLRLRIEAGFSLVGFARPLGLREDVFNVANRNNVRAGVEYVDAVYDTAMMGGEPFAIWH